MELKKLSSGNLRAVGYDERNRVLQVETTGGTFQYSGISSDVYRRFVAASSPWSYYRDNIEEEFPAQRIR
jgi:hypothetical protein